MQARSRPPCPLRILSGAKRQPPQARGCTNVHENAAQRRRAESLHLFQEAGRMNDLEEEGKQRETPAQRLEYFGNRAIITTHPERIEQWLARKGISRQQAPN